jgi:hypothetical protein
VSDKLREARGEAGCLSEAAALLEGRRARAGSSTGRGRGLLWAAPLLPSVALLNAGAGSLLAMAASPLPGSGASCAHSRPLVLLLMPGAAQLAASPAAACRLSAVALGMREALDLLVSDRASGLGAISEPGAAPATG